MKIFRISDFVMAGSWLLAFIFSLPLIEPMEWSRLAAILCMTVFAGVGFGRELAGPGLPVSRSPVFWLLPLLWLLSLATIAWSAAPMVTFVSFATLSLAVLGFVLFSSGRGSFRLIVPLGPFIALALALLGLGAIVQYLFFPGMLVYGAVRWPFANPNNYASLLMLGLFPAIGMMLAAVKRGVGIGATVVAMILLAAIIIIGGRAVMLLTVIGLIAIAFACRDRLSRHRVGFALVILAGFAALALQFGLAGQSGRANPVTTRTEAFLHPHREESVVSRHALWRSTLAMIHDHGIAGTGYGTFYLFYPQYRMPGDTASAGLMAHNDLLQSWAEMGIAAPLLLLLLFAGAACRMGKVMMVRGPESGERTLCFALFAGAGLVACNSMVNFDLYTASILCLLGLVLGLWFRYTALVLGDDLMALRLPASWSAPAGWAVAFVPLLIILFLTQGFLRADYLTDQAQSAAAQGSLDQFASRIERARSASFDWDANAYVLAATVPIAILERSHQALSTPARTELVQHATELLDRAEARNPRLPAIDYDRAVIVRYGLDHDDKDAESWLKQALVLDPGHYPSRMMLADLAFQAGRKQEALQILADGMDLPVLSRDPENYYAMTASLALEQGDIALNETAVRRLGNWKGLRSALPASDAMPMPLR
jgi:O-antigen ligase